MFTIYNLKSTQIYPQTLIPALSRKLPHLHPSNEKTALSILTTLLSNISWLLALKKHLTNQQRFTFSDYMQNGSGWLFIATTPKNRDSLQLLQTALLDLAVIHLMELGADKKRRMWFILDELASMRKLIKLP